MTSPASLGLLLGPRSPDLLAAALDSYGGTLGGLRVASVAVRPGGAAVVQYVADVRRADGRRTREVLAATTGDRIPAGAAVLAGEHEGRPVQVGVWRWPQDPALHALETATDPVRLGELLAAAGLHRTARPQVRVRSYRPGRRAVLEVTGGGPRLYVKVLRPGAVDGLRRRHDLLAPVLPVPPVLAATADGLVVLPEMPGAPMRALLGPAAPVPDALDALLDRLPRGLVELPGRPTPLQRVPHFAAMLALTADASAHGLLEDLATELEAVDPGTPPTEPVHGDFYEAQLLVGAGAVTGLLDVDTAGPGHRIDEWATLLAHLSVVALHSGPARRYGADVLAHAERAHPRDQLRPRIAAVVLGLATGPFRVQQPGWAAHTRRRLALARQWLR
jgi:hypothetical protein